jgi:hypothetical protein
MCCFPRTTPTETSAAFGGVEVSL